MTALLQLLFVGVSLQSFYFYGVHLPVLSIASLAVLGVVLFATEQGEIRIPMNMASSVATWYLVVFVWASIGLLVYNEAPNPKRNIAFLTVAAGALVAVLLYKRVSMEKLIRAYLVIHVPFFFIQFVLYYGAGYVMDYLLPITGEEQRVLGGSFKFPFTNIIAIRAAGLFVEPGTYATFLAPAVALFDRWYGDSKFNKRVFWVSLASLFISFSVFGIVFGTLIVLFSKHISRGWRIAGLVGSFLLVAPVLYYRFIIRASFGLDTGVGFRRTIISSSFHFLANDPIGFIFGSNLLVLNPRIPYVGAFNDVGLLLFLLHFAGPLMTVLFCAVVIYAGAKMDTAARVGLLIVLLSKHSPFSPFFAFVMVGLLWRDRSQPDLVPVVA